jgi:hypothetical protein
MEMADQERSPQTVSLQGGGSISLDQLVSATSASVLRVIREHETQQSPFKINPKIWVGIWIDLDRFGPGGPLGGPGGGPAGGGGIG